MGIAKRLFKGNVMELIAKYNHFLISHDIEEDALSSSLINIKIRGMLKDFMKEHNNVAIYCYGQHTEMILAEFVSELRNIVCIVDNYKENRENEGYKIIKDDEIEDNQIDAVIISSFGLRKMISESLEQKHPSLAVLDIYDELEKQGIQLKYSYYQADHPLHNYGIINQLQRELKECKDKNHKIELLYEIVFKYVHIKDLYSAIRKAEELQNICPSLEHQNLLKELHELYDMELKLAEQISKNNILMLCVDALRAQDFSKQAMPQIYEALCKKGFVYSKAYAYSTSTYESLIPAYSGNNDMRTHYYERESVRSEECPFYYEAKKRGRNVYFYTDMGEYIEDDEIRRVGRSQTTSEKIWSFLIDASKEKNGLFYIHNSFESHFSYANPYTEAELVIGGQNILYDYLEQKGGSLRTDYVKQHEDAIRYIDDMLGPFVQRMKNKMIFYSDHGTILIEKNKQLDEVKNEYLICHEACIRIPFVIISDKQGVGMTEEMISLMDFNEVMQAMLDDKAYLKKKKEWIKIGRSAIYNPDLKSIYKRKNLEKGLSAFEGFIFPNGEKLIVYSDGSKELYQIEDDSIVDNQDKANELYEMVNKEVTVMDV